MITEVTVRELPELDRQLKNELMKDLSPDDLAKIKKGFNLYTGGVNVKQFIVLMIDALYNQYSSKNRIRQILTFIELFLLIDINSRGKIKFENFTNFLIDRRSKQEKIQSLQFFPVKNLSHIEVGAETVYPLHNCPYLGLLNNARKNVDLVDTKNFKTNQSISFGGVLINNIIYLPKYGIYCIATNDKYLNFYEALENILVKRFSLPDSIFFMLEFQDKLLVAATQGNIYELSLRKILEKVKKKNQQNLLAQFIPKQSQVEEADKKKVPLNELYKTYMCSSKVIHEQSDLTCIDLLQALELVVTGSNDCRVRLYEMKDNGLHLMKQLNGHFKGIKGVTVSNYHKVIISCSFDFDLLVWNAYLQHPVARLEGHEAPLVTVYCPKQHQIIISLDYKGIMKIWNCQTYVLLQNLTIIPTASMQPSNSESLSFNFVYKEECNLAIIYRRRLLFYEFAVTYNPKLTDNQDITSIKYSPKNLELYIGSKRSIKVWSVKEGILSKTYSDVIDSDISIIQLDGRQRRIFIGSIEGDIISIDIFSGLVINHYSRHSMEISMLIYNNKDQLLLSGGWDKIIKIHNDTHHLERIESRENVLRNIKNIHQKELANGSFSSVELLMATHCRTKILRFWDFEKGYLEAQIIVPNDINLIHFINPLPLMVVSDIKGGVYIFNTKYSDDPFHLIASWKNMYSIQKTSLITFISSIFNKSKQSFTCQILLGDQFGYLRVMDITEFIFSKKIKPVLAQQVGNKNPFRIEDYINSGSSQLSVNTHDFQREETKNIVPPPYFKQKLQIRAHNDRLTYACTIQEGQDKMYLTSGSDKLVRLWSVSGQPKGVMRQANKTLNQSWQYSINKSWKTRQVETLEEIQKDFDKQFQDYMERKRQNVIPFTEQQKFQETDNKQIYKSLQEIDTYLEKYSQKVSKRLY